MFNSSLKTKCCYEVLMICFLKFVNIIEEAQRNFISPVVGLILKCLLLDMKDEKLLTVQISIFNL